MKSGGDPRVCLLLRHLAELGNGLFVRRLGLLQFR